MEHNWKQNNEEVLESLCPGDLVEFVRGKFSHWGVYIGNQDVVHLVGVDELEPNVPLLQQSLIAVSGVISNKGKICCENFWKVARQDKAKKNNSSDSHRKHLKPDQIVKNAKSKEGETDYNLFFENCEHFAQWCRYGVKESKQVDYWAFLGAAGFVAFTILPRLLFR